MTQLKELRKQAKEKGLRGYSTLCKEDLELLLQGKSIPKKLKKNQVNVSIQTDFPLCHECALTVICKGMKLEIEANRQRKTENHTDSESDNHTCTDIMTDGDIKICVDCGVVCGMEVDYGGDFSSMKILSTKKK